MIHQGYRIKMNAEVILCRNCQEIVNRSKSREYQQERSFLQKKATKARDSCLNQEADEEEDDFEDIEY